MRALILFLFVSGVALSAQAQTDPVPLSPGQRVESYLTTDSPRLPDFPAPYACYSIETLAGETWEIDVSSFEFSPELVVGKGDNCVAVYDNIFDNMNGDPTETGYPVLNFTTHSDGHYLIVVSPSRADDKGPFVLTAKRVPAP